MQNAHLDAKYESEEYMNAHSRRNSSEYAKCCEYYWTSHHIWNNSWRTKFNVFHGL